MATILQFPVKKTIDWMLDHPSAFEPEYVTLIRLQRHIQRRLEPVITPQFTPSGLSTHFMRNFVDKFTNKIK